MHREFAGHLEGNRPPCVPLLSTVCQGLLHLPTAQWQGQWTKGQGHLLIFNFLLWKITELGLRDVLNFIKVGLLFFFRLSLYTVFILHRLNLKRAMRMVMSLPHYDFSGC